MFVSFLEGNSRYTVEAHRGINNKEINGKSKGDQEVSIGIMVLYGVL